MINEITVHTFGELQKAGNTAIAALGNSDTWFRGHADASWQLRPHIFRRFTHSQEIKLFGMFQLRAVGLRKGCPNLDNTADWLCLMQHHGLPTRLLDWSRSLAVAAFFAVSRERGCGDATIWAMSPLILNARMLNTPKLVTLNHSKLEPIVKGATHFNYEGADAGAVCVPEIDQRMVAQQTAFTIHGSRMALEDGEGASDFLFRIRIPERHRAHFSVAMSHFGIRLTSMFPDLPNLAEELVGNELHGGTLWPADEASGYCPEQVAKSKSLLAGPG
jgi:hypothetical protein